MPLPAGRRPKRLTRAYVLHPPPRRSDGSNTNDNASNVDVVYAVLCMERDASDVAQLAPTTDPSVKAADQAANANDDAPPARSPAADPSDDRAGPGAPIVAPSDPRAGVAIDGGDPTHAGAHDDVDEMTMTLV